MSVSRKDAADKKRRRRRAIQWEAARLKRLEATPATTEPTASTEPAK